MKNIFIYIGSPKGDISNTVRFAKDILDKVTYNSKDKIQYEIFTPKNTNIYNCTGCTYCFFKGHCIFDKDKADHMNMLKEKMIKSDFIILGSPVYATNISGNMKTFVDRISYWLHLMRLAGKPGVILSTASSNGSDFVFDYLHKIMNYLGIKVVGEFNAFVDSPRQLDNKEFIETNISKYADIILDYISENKQVQSDDMLEAIFNAYKTSIMKMKGTDIPEYLYWEKSNMLNCSNFAEVIKYNYNENLNS